MGKKIFGKNNHSIKKKVSNHQKNIEQYLILSMIIISLVRIGFIILFNRGFIPIGEFLEIQEPIGNLQEIEIEEYLDKFPEIKNISAIKKLKFKTYITNESIAKVRNNYIERLENNGYNFIYEGNIIKSGISYQYCGFLKGFTLIGIVMTSNSNIKYENETMVLYTTGSVFDYNKIIKLNREQIGL
jgi:hypothetical protein